MTFIFTTSDLEKQIVFLFNRLIRVRKSKFFRPIFCVSFWVIKCLDASKYLL